MDRFVHIARPVNVSRVPQRSPFRYPGGKTWLVPGVRSWFASLPRKPGVFCEPFAGGGIISLTVAFEQLAEHVKMIELDSQVAAVWKTMLQEGGADWLADRIMEFQPTVESVRDALSAFCPTARDRAFQTIVKNRTYHGGILANGSAPIKRGENGKGIGSRWYPTTLARRIRAIGKIRERITFIEGDGLHALEEGAERKDTVWFIDPPYTASRKNAGSRLYTHFALDHDRLFRLVQNLAGDFLMTYDNADEIRQLAASHNLETALVAMTNTHNYKMTELIVGRNLDWVGKRDAEIAAAQPALALPFVAD